MTRIAELRPRRWSWALVLLAPAAVAFASSDDRGGLFAPRADAAAPAAVPSRASRPAPVTVAPVVRREIAQAVAVSGTLVARDEVLVSPQIEGVRLDVLLVDLGDTVRAGEVLARLDRSVLETRLAQNASELAKATAEMAQARAAIAEAEASEAEAGAALKRARTLKGAGHGTEETLQARETAALVAAARVGARREALGVAQAQRDLVEAQGRELALSLARTEITSPAAGVVASRSAHVGQTVSTTGEPLFRVIRDGVVEFAAEITEGSLHLVEAGQPVSVSVGGLPGVVGGLVRLVAPTVDDATRLGVAKVTLPMNPGLRPGGFASGTVETARRDGAVVPRSAVSFGPSGPSVQLVEDGRVAVRGVAVGLGDADGLEILAGLAPGDEVVARAGGFLRDGDRVTAVRPEAAEAPAAPVVAAAN